MTIPLGMLLQQLDHAITAAFDHALADRSTTRVEWQMLNVLDGAPDGMPWSAIEDRMPPGPDADAMATSWQALEVGGWVEEVGGLRRLTAAGEEAREALAGDVQRIREQATEGVTDEDYETTMEVLELMLENLSD